VLLVIVDAATMEPLLPLNILFTIILTRLALPLLTQPGIFRFDNLLVVLMLIACIGIPTWVTIEYGTMAFLFAMLGYLVRRGGADKYEFGALIGVTVVFYAVWQQLTFDFSTTQTWIVGIGTLTLLLGLTRFINRPIEGTANLPVLSSLGRFMGRYTLELYTVHLIVFGVIAFWLADYPDFAVYLYLNPQKN